jgi:hypothetical protein
MGWNGGGKHTACSDGFIYWWQPIIWQTRDRDRERLKDGDTAVSSLFASQEEKQGNRGNESYIDHTLSKRCT